MKLVFSGLVDTKTRNQLVVKSVHSSGSLNSFFSVFVIIIDVDQRGGIEECVTERGIINNKYNKQQ